MKLHHRELGTEFDAAPGTWVSWLSAPPPRNIGPVLCESRYSGRITVDPSIVDPAWNVCGVSWQVPIEAMVSPESISRRVA